MARKLRQATLIRLRAHAVDLLSVMSKMKHDFPSITIKSGFCSSLYCSFFLDNNLATDLYATTRDRVQEKKEMIISHFISSNYTFDPITFPFVKLINLLKKAYEFRAWAKSHKATSNNRPNLWAEKKPTCIANEYIFEQNECASKRISCCRKLHASVCALGHSSPLRRPFFSISFGQLTSNSRLNVFIQIWKKCLRLWCWCIDFLHAVFACRKPKQ